MTSTRPDQQVFIGGCSRSGTTLLGAMIGAHSDCICTPESHFKIDVLRAIAKGMVAETPSALLELTNQHWRFKIWELALNTADIPVSVDSYPRLLTWIIKQYARQQGKPEAHIWIDHTPENMSYSSSLLALFPNAKMIHIVRDGRAVAASVLPLDWGPNTIIKAARWWMRMASFGLAAESTFGPERIMRVQYEDLVLKPEISMRAVSDFLQVDYQPGMMQATGFAPPKYTSGQHKLVGTRPDPDVVTRWEKKLSAREVEIFEHLTRDFMTYLGYPLQYGLRAKAPTFMEIQKGKVNELFRGEIANKFKWLRRSYPLWASRDFYAQARLTDINN